MFLVGSGGGSRAPENRQVGIPVSGGQLRRFPGALYLDDLLVDPDEPTPRPSEAVLAVGGDGGALGEGDEYLTVAQLARYSKIGRRQLARAGRLVDHALVHPGRLRSVAISLPFRCPIVGYSGVF
jgi:hypothetical protein